MNLSALKSPPFRSYVLSLHLALTGFWAQRVIIGWLAWEMTGSAGFVGPPLHDRGGRRRGSRSLDLQGRIKTADSVSGVERGQLVGPEGSVLIG